MKAASLSLNSFGGAMKLQAGRASTALALGIVAVMAMSGSAHAQPNPYRWVQNWAKLPQGRAFGSVIAVDVDRQGNIWAFERYRY